MDSVHSVGNSHTLGIGRNQRVQDRLVWFENVEALLPRNEDIWGQFEFAAMNLVFSADFFYSFHRYRFDGDAGFENMDQMDSFFVSRRALSIRSAMDCDLFFCQIPTQIWCQIVGFEPPPFRSLMFYQFVRQKDAVAVYKVPVFMGFMEMALMAMIAITLCLHHHIESSDILQIWNWHSVSSSTVNMLCFALILVAILHILGVIVVFVISRNLMSKIADFKHRIGEYLNHRRKLEMKRIHKMCGGNKMEMERERGHRLYFKVNPRSLLHEDRNGELFLSVLKWLGAPNLKEPDLDFLLSDGTLLRFAVHKYFGLILFALTVCGGINVVTMSLIAVWTLSLWTHWLMIDGDKSFGAAFCEILKCALWPGMLFYAVTAYSVYTVLFPIGI